MALLTLSDVWFKYVGSDHHVLRGVNLDVNNYELSVISGPNGAGKTTLLLIAAGLLPPERGEVLLDGRPLHQQLPSARKRIGITFQEPEDQFFNPPVVDEVAYALRQLGMSEEGVRTEVIKVADILGIKHLLGRPPYKLSGGEKVKVALASVLVYDPEILLLDEPTAYLTSSAKAELMKYLETLRDGGKAVVIATNDSEVLKHSIDRHYQLDCGVLREVRVG